MKLYILAFLVATQLWAAPAGTKGEDGNFKISEKSLQHMGISFEALKETKLWLIPVEALVKIKLSNGVYRRYQNEITYVLVKVHSHNGKTVTISSEDLEAGDEVAVKGAQFLRMAETDLNSETVDNCAH